jgi:hypothetical protein
MSYTRAVPLVTKLYRFYRENIPGKNSHCVITGTMIFFKEVDHVMATIKN